MSRITIVGAGYVGLVTGACFADTGNEVWCVDKDLKKIEKIKGGELPIYEPGLESVVKRGIAEGRLRFTTRLKEGIQESQICFLAVDTPPDETGSPDLRNIFDVAKALGESLDHPILVVTKSTVPVGTTLKIREILHVGLKGRPVDIDQMRVASNPEFLKEGNALQDFRYPDRIVIGVESPDQAEPLKELYAPFMRRRDCLLVMDIASAELAKYAANAMLANRISFMNEIANLSEAVGADIDKIRESIGWDARIGPKFLYSGLGYGGSCLPKDVLALIQLGRKSGREVPILEAIDKINQNQRVLFFEKIVSAFGSSKDMEGCEVAIWGLSFKPETDDIRQAPSLYFIEELLKRGARVRVFDPASMERVKALFGEKITYCPENYHCLEGADCLIIATEWNLFRAPNFPKMRQLMRRPLIFDGRNLYPPQKMREMGFDYFSIGR